MVGTRKLKALTLLGALMVLPGCAAAVGAAAGAGAMAYRQDQTATTSVQANLDEVAAWTRTAFADMGIAVTKTSEEDDERELIGESGDLTVKAKLEREGGRTEVSVVAARNYVDYDKSFAQSVVDRIMMRGR